MSEPSAIKNLNVNGTTYDIQDDSKLASSLKGAANGVAELDNTGKVPSTQLPANILEYDSLADFPETGSTGKVYIAEDTNIIYRWDDTNDEYVPISSSGGGASALHKIQFSIATTDWTAVTGGYAATVTDSNIRTSSEEFFSFTSSLKNLNGDLDTSKDAANHSIIFITNNIPNGTISGTIYSLMNPGGSVAIELVEDKLPVDKGGTNATDAATARTNLGAASASDLTALVAQKGAANGIATLDANGKVPSGQLPSYADDVLEYASQSDFPATGETGKIYVADDVNELFRWDTTESEYVSVGGGSNTGLTRINLSIALADWTEVTGGYTATVTDSSITTDSEEVVIFNESQTKLTSNIGYIKDASSNTLTFMVASIPGGTISGRILVFTEDIRMTYSDFRGATAQAAGQHGLVPAPAVADKDKFLKGDGTWANVDALPAAPSSDGTYYLQCVVSNGSAAYSWVTIPAASGVSF